MSFFTQTNQPHMSHDRGANVYSTLVNKIPVRITRREIAPRMRNARCDQRTGTSMNLNEN